MSAAKRLTDLIDYTAILPYASEMFGIYQPLLGWKSRRMEERFGSGFEKDKRQLIDRLKREFSGLVELQYDGDVLGDVRIRPGVLDARAQKPADSVLIEELGRKLPTTAAEVTHDDWLGVINPGEIQTLFDQVVGPRYIEFQRTQLKDDSFNRMPAMLARADVGRLNRATARTAFESQLRYESALGGALLHLAETKQYDTLRQVFYSAKDNTEQAQIVLAALAAPDPIEGYLDLEHLNPRERDQLQRVALSPISVVHLFRQYFFELDSFLGTPVGHVWLSPGSTVELIEVQTRRTIVEKTLEQTLETTLKAESETTEQEEISEAVKEDNKQDVKFGASVTASYASIVANSSFDYNTSQQQSREETHKRMRQQTEKLSSEIRKNFKSTFKTITETMDSSSKRYVLANSTQELINYEMRRKMRQVAVQVQDIGSYLCWQTYVDDPGESLGVAKLMHIAKPAELDGLHAPEEIPLLQPFAEQKVVTIPFISIEGTDADNENEVYQHGVEVDDSEFLGNLEKIQADFPIECVCPRGDYVLQNVEFDGMGKPVSASRSGAIANSDNRSTFTLHLDSADFQGQNSVQVQLTLHWSPAAGANDEAIQKNKENVAQFKAREAAEYQKAFVENARQRVKLMHQIETRPSEDLREEERIVVYRKLIQDLLTNGVPMPDDRTRHIVAELINSIFDVDKMLYFVAPEWWRPRLRDHRQQLEPSRSGPAHLVANLDVIGKGVLSKLFGVTATATADKLAGSTIGWGGIDDPARDNYYITEDSKPAKFGSSLGWLLELDGDNMRNAFLNAPWVKAVIPIRPGKEEAAINWLKGVEGFNGITDADLYQTDNPDEKDINGQPLDGQKMIDVILDLARKIQRKHRQGVEQGTFPKASEVDDPQLVDAENVVTATPIDRVYEHGFFPLAGGFRANVTGNYEIFDQWLEILPTDQVVPVEVQYDPKTGRQV
ncbi:hypothetical protein ACWGST_03080 [Agromyces sp. NPDC055520]